ncbi:cystinosin homolog [Panulirus ornatus]|uniref:cystinosin homolog n=1 Tax=Panulirus ornatus TaxID=150431 RepID=UPI003A88FA23
MPLARFSKDNQERNTPPSAMAATTSTLGSFLHPGMAYFLLNVAVALPSSGSAGAQALETPVSSLYVITSPQANNFTATCIFETNDLKVALHHSKNLTFNISGSVEQVVTLSFVFHGRKILNQLGNISVTPDELNETHTVDLMGMKAGHTVLKVNATPESMVDVSRAFVRVDVFHSDNLDYLSDIVGWIYFVAWSVSFYPQTYINWRRKSVIGLHFDFLSLNIIGFLLYSLFNVCLYWSPAIQQQYFHRHPLGVNPVQMNDVIFSVHAFFACFIQLIQCCIYERGDQQVSKTAKAILFTIVLVTVLMIILSSAAVVQWLDFLYYVSYVKLFITLIKYIPQAYYNYRRKSTSGWSIGNIFLDFTGGTLSIVQMFVLAVNYNDWGSIFGDPTKFGLGLFSIIFDIFFMIQHYILYRGNEGYQRNLNSPQPTHSSSLTDSIASVDYGAVGSLH